MLRTVDTNILVRGLVSDGSEQSRIADGILSSETIYVPSTVLLESEWVLRTRFGATRQMIAKLFSGLVGMPNVDLENRNIVASAIEAHSHGLDFADAMHLYGAGETDDFLTFDKTLVRRAKKLSDIVPVVVPTLTA